MYETIQEFVKKQLLDKDVVINTESFKNKDLTKFISLVVVISLVIFILFLYLGKYIWNNVLCKSVSGVKPVNSILAFLGLWFLAQLLFTK